MRFLGSLEGAENTVPNLSCVTKSLEAWRYTTPSVVPEVAVFGSGPKTRDGQGYSTADISEMLDISQGAVKTRLFRARERFREAYAEED